MTDVIKIANERRARLVAEIRKMDDFIRMAEALTMVRQYHAAILDVDRPVPTMLAAGIGRDVDFASDEFDTPDGAAMISAGSQGAFPVAIDGEFSVPRNRSERSSAGRKVHRFLAIRSDDTGSSYVDFKSAASIRLWIKGYIDTALSNIASRSRIERRLAELDRASGLEIHDDNDAARYPDVGSIASLGRWIRNFVVTARSNLLTIDQLRDQWALKGNPLAAGENTVAVGGGVQDSLLQFSTARAASIATPRTGTGRFATGGKASIAEDELLLTNPQPSKATPVDVHVGQRLRQRRWMMGMTQQQLGDLVGVSFRQIQNYESGASRISAGRMWDVAMATGVPVLFFFEGLDGQAPDTGETRVEVLNDHEAEELVRAYCAVPEDQRQRLFDLARVLSEAA